MPLLTWVPPKNATALFWADESLEEMLDLVNRTQPLLQQAFETRNPSLLMDAFVDSPDIQLMRPSDPDIPAILNCEIEDGNYVYDVTSTALHDWCAAR